MQLLKSRDRLIEPFVDLFRDVVELVEYGREQRLQVERGEIADDLVVDRQRRRENLLEVQLAEHPRHRIADVVQHVEDRLERIERIEVVLQRLERVERF